MEAIPSDNVMFYDTRLLLEEGKECFELGKSYGFVEEQQFAAQKDLNKTVMYHKLCHGAMKHDKPLNDNTKSETQTMNAPFGKKNDFDFMLSLLEGTLPSHSDVWNH